MALLEGHGQKELKIDESMPYSATITHAITVDDHVVNNFKIHNYVNKNKFSNFFQRNTLLQ